MIEIKKLETVEEFHLLRDIQKDAWNFGDTEVDPPHLMMRVQKYGGLVEGLFVDGELVGFTYGIIARWEDTYLIYSHMLAVKKAHQSCGYGFLLKKSQRDSVIALGYDTIIWNFDPLESLNSFFNIHRLGAVSTEYDINIYGDETSGLHAGLPTDRLIATWHLKTDRVAQRMEVKHPRLLEEIDPQLDNRFDESTAFIEIPVDIRTVKEKDMGAAVDWRMRTRDLFLEAMEKGYTVEEMVFSVDGQRLFYQLRRPE